MTEQEIKQIKAIAEQAFDKAFARFKFEKAQKCMAENNWVWAMIPGGCGVPTVNDIQNTVNYLFNACTKDWDGIRVRSVSTGGFRVMIIKWESGYNVEIIFEFTEADCSFTAEGVGY